MTRPPWGPSCSRGARWRAPGADPAARGAGQQGKGFVRPGEGSLGPRRGARVWGGGGNPGERYNRLYGETFVVPEPHIVKATARILDLQRPDKQMSKSLGGSGCLNLLDDPKGPAIQRPESTTQRG